ncbi:4772_t:CDS:2, partial [Gigaspora margarita]
KWLFLKKTSPLWIKPTRNVEIAHSFWKKVHESNYGNKNPKNGVNAPMVLVISSLAVKLKSGPTSPV